MSEKKEDYPRTHIRQECSYERDGGGEEHWYGNSGVNERVREMRRGGDPVALFDGLADPHSLRLWREGSASQQATAA